MQGWCAKLDQDRAQIRQGKDIDALTSRWSASERQAFRQLQQAANEYFQASSQNEVDLSGSGRAAFEIEREQKLKSEFLAALHRFETGDLPNFTADQFREADANLNADYPKSKVSRPRKAWPIARDPQWSEDRPTRVAPLSRCPG